MFIELTSDDQSRLSALAASTKRSEAEVAEEAMRWFLAGHEDSFAAAITEGDEDFNRGDFFEHQEVVAMFNDVLDRR